MTDNNIQIAVCGCGHWGKNHIRNYAELGALAALCDPNENLATEFAEKYGVNALSFEDILKTETIDGIVLASPAHLHADMALQAIAAGKHVFVEKPLALTVADAQQVVDAAKAANVTLMVGHLLHYHAGFEKVKQLITQDKILGNLRFIEARRVSTGKIRMEENALWSFGPHDISMILSLLSNQMPTSVKSTAKAYIQDKIEDVVHLDMDFENGVSAHVVSSWLYPEKEHKMIIAGEDGFLIFDDREPTDRKIKILRHEAYVEHNIPLVNKDDEGEYIPVDNSEPLRAECQHFIDCIANGATPLTDGEEGLRVLTILEQASQ